MTDEQDHPLKILIAEDSAPDRLILESIIDAAGHRYVSAADGREAVESFVKEHPDIVLLDVMMPYMSGIEAARRIRELAERDLVPIIFLTSLSDTESLVECLDAGGDDFLPKPYNRVVLESKIKAFGRTRELHRTLAKQTNQIEKHNAHLIREQEVAKQVFDKIAHTGCLNLSNIRYYMSPLAVFNGDVLVAEISPNGSMMVLLGDFTGHGLPAAIGSMPLASTFYGMVRKGFSMQEILKEANQKLNQILPVGFFCCATFIDISFIKRRLKIWNGGLPESFLYRKHTDDYQLIHSKNLPLGVLGNKDFNTEIHRLDLNIGDRFYMWSDGIFEARNRTGEMYGEDRLHQTMHEFKGSDALFDQILGNVQRHIGTSEKNDDISLVEIKVEDVELVSNARSNSSSRHLKATDWAMDFEVENQSLRDFDPLPMLVNVVSEVPGLRQNSAVIYTLIAELYNNGLEHGVLGLPSSLKSSPAGFAEYYKLRTERVAELKEGKITVKLRHQSDSEGGFLTIRVIDSGDGFDSESQDWIENATEAQHSPRNYFGRGLKLIKSMCHSLTIHPPGNDVETVFRWYFED